MVNESGWLCNVETAAETVESRREKERGRVASVGKEGVGEGSRAGRVHLISAITDPLFCQIGADLILSASASDAFQRPMDDSSTGNWRIVRNRGLHSISFVKKRSSQSR